MKQIPLAIGPEPARTFENFLPGANAAALAHLLALRARRAAGLPLGARRQRQDAPAACGRRSAPQARGESAAWFSAAIAAAVAGGRASATGSSSTTRHAFDAAQQHAAFSLFVDATARGAVVLAAGNVPPVDLAGARGPAHAPRLGPRVRARSRSAEPEVRAALRREADRRGTFLSDEVMDYLLTRFARDLKHLMAQLDRLDEFSLATKRAITVPLLKQMLAEEEAT